MNRLARSHRSTKIPNVKLRPASRSSDADSSTQQQNKRYKHQSSIQDNREDDQHFRQLRDTGIDHGAHLDADFIGSSARPLKGAVLSITGLSEVKVALTQHAKELGARVEGHLTEDVTHLIADRPGSEKYRFALDLGMHIIRPEWITQLRQSWLEGQDVDAETLQEKFRLEALSNTTLCFAGLTAAQRQTWLPLAQQLGATISSELRFDGTITHLVSGTDDPQSSSSIHYVLHFLERARQGRTGTREQAANLMAVIRPEWLHDCDQAQGCLPEQLYSVFNPLPSKILREQLVQRAVTKIPSPFSRKSAPIAVQSPFTTGSRPSSLRHSYSTRNLGEQQTEEDEDELITLGTRQTAEKSFDHIFSHLKNRGTNDSPTQARSLTVPVPSVASQRNGLLSMSRASSFSPAPTTLSAANTLKRKPSSSLVFLPTASGMSSATPSPARCFHGRSFKIAVADSHRSSVLKGVLQTHGASVLDLHDAITPEFCLVDSTLSADSPLCDTEATAVTHFWIEFCLHHERFFEPATYFASSPALVPMPLPQAETLQVALIGFEQDSPEAYHARKLVEELGGHVAEQFTKEAVTHMVCATKESFEGRRAHKARTSGIAVVGLDFLTHARRTGRLLPGPASPQIVDTTQSSTLQHEAHLPLAGCVVSRTKALASQNGLLERKTLQLGATYQAVPCDATTHLLHSGTNLPREAREMSRGVFLVHPSWLDKCQDEHLRVDESLVPSSLNPSRSLATVLANSDGSNTGNFLSQASQATQMQAPKSAQTQTQAALVAAAKPWHRSVSTGTASLHPMSSTPLPLTDAARETARRRSESPELLATMEMDPVEPDLDTTLQGTEDANSDEEAVVAAPSSQTLCEEEVYDKRQRSISPLVQAKAKLEQEREETQMASADQVMSLLRNRALAQGSKKKKGRLPPRFRKHGARSSHSPSPSSTMGASSITDGTPIAPEQVLELQARKDAERAAEAAAHGFSLGLEKDFAPNGERNSQPDYDASIRIVYDDPAARKERHRLFKILAKTQASHTSPTPDADEQTASSALRDSAAENQAHQQTRISPDRNEDTFGSGRRGRHAWHNRQSESPTKRPVVRRQPLARH